MTSDLDLVRQYVDANSQAAFAELVRRYVDLVYSSARRQVGSPDLAKDVAQIVFLKLSNQAAQLRPATQLGPWLHVVTRHAAVDLVRHEQRRQAREEKAVEEIAMMHAPESNWTEIEPLLDEAVASLAKSDRDAVVLRYFEGKSFREVGGALAISDDAAQKRVSRAIARLQDFFRKRGVPIGAVS
jgi:RNA polymerase sigma factor (sigma-70 family)